MLNAAFSPPPASCAQGPTVEFRKLCHYVVKARELADSVEKVARSNSFWVYTSFYDKEPVGILFSPTQSLVFFLPFDEQGEVDYRNVSYLLQTYDDVLTHVRSGKSVLLGALGDRKHVPDPSLLLWLQRAAQSLKG